MNDKQALHDFPTEITDRVNTPCYLMSRNVIRRNCEILDDVQKKTGAKILLALKAFAMPAVFDIISEYLHGVCASGPIEAQMGREEFGREVHTYSPAFSDEQFERTVRYSDHIIFNSISQWQLFKDNIPAEKQVGLRVNPGHSEVEVDLYNPCIAGSRFGVNPSDLDGLDLTEIDGLHFHAMCEQDADVLVRVLRSFEDRFGKLIPQMKWINFGGGHHITREDYQLDLLINTINDFKSRYDVDVYLEPGEAVVLNAGVFVTSVLDTITNGEEIAILDCSAETHMPDVIAMPYRPHLVGAGEAAEKEHTYKLGGISCLAGDFIDTYSFAKPLTRGDKLVFTDMALYSFVKNTTFNGVELPDLAVFDSSGSVEVVRSFGYSDYRGRLA